MRAIVSAALGYSQKPNSLSSSCLNTPGYVTRYCSVQVPTDFPGVWKSFAFISVCQKPFDRLFPDSEE